MSNYTICTEFIKLAGESNRHLFNCLFIFIQDNPYKVCIDSHGKILSAYAELANNNNDIRNWLNYMSYTKETSFEKITINIPDDCPIKKIMVDVATSMFGDRKLIARTKQNYIEYEDIIVGFNVNIIDKDEALASLSPANIVINAVNSNVACGNSTITVTGG